MPPLIVASIQHMFDWRSQICREALPVQDQCSRHPNSAGSLAAWWSTSGQPGTETYMECV